MSTTYAERFLAFDTFATLMRPEHARECAPGACICPLDVFYAAVRLARTAHRAE